MKIEPLEAGMLFTEVSFVAHVPREVEAIHKQARAAFAAEQRRLAESLNDYSNEDFRQRDAEAERINASLRKKGR